MNNRKSLDLSTQGIKELFFALKKIGKTSSTAIEVMLAWGYTDEELWLLCNNRYIVYTEYIEGVFNFHTNLPQLRG